MSSRGVSQAELERRRQEQIRREQERKRQEEVRVRTEHLCEQVQTIVLGIVSSGWGDQVRTEIEEANKEREASLKLLKSNVDTAEEKAQRTLATVETLEGIAEARKQSLQVELDELKIELNACVSQVKDFRECTKDNVANGDAAKLLLTLADVREKFKLTSNDEIESAIKSAREKLQAIKTESEERAVAEQCRKHIIKSLRDSMQELGFLVGSPRIVRDAGQVVIEGRMANGRLAQFRVNVEGQMEFDLDGYIGRECSNDLDAVLEQMKEKYGVNCSPPQHNWKNPDRISKGSKDFPDGGTSNTRTDC